MGDASAPPEHFEYRPALDGLRAVAVGAVLLFHHYQFDPINGRGWEGGFLGVDVFFVLSGYLITSILLVEHGRDGRISLPRFWARRARRLLPALFAMLGFAAILAATALPARELPTLRRDIFSALLYVENWNQVARTTTAVGHTWSLAVEEQWYLVWPLLLSGILFVLRRTRRERALVPIIGGLAVASSIAMAWLYQTRGLERAYNGTDARAQGLLVGAALAALSLRSPHLWQPSRRQAVNTFALLSAAIIGWMFLAVHVSSSFMYRGGFLVFALLVAVVVAATANDETSLLARVLSWRPLRAVGQVSYGVYLFHWPVYWWLTPTRTSLGSVALLALRAAVTAALTVVSFFLIERPIRFGFARRPRLLQLAALTLAASLVVTAAIASTARKAPSLVPPGVLYAFAHKARNTPANDTRLLIVGDGSALQVARAGGTFFTSDGVRGGTYGVFGCGIAAGRPIVFEQAMPVSDDCQRAVEAYGPLVDVYRPHVAVLMVGTTEALDRVVYRLPMRAGSSELERYLDNRLERARRALTAHGAHLILITRLCDFHPTPDSTRRSRWLEQVFLRYASHHRADTTTASLAAFACPTGRSAVTSDGTGIYYAGAPTAKGAAAIYAWLATLARQVTSHP